MSGITEQAASVYLGKKVDGSKQYDPSLLVSVPRIENRSQYGIDNANLPFMGWDVWHAYEFSCMTKNGLPYTRVIKLRYACDSEFIVESKSLKLYFNSFNMSRFGNSVSESIDICKKLIQKDLSEKLKTNVEIHFLDNTSERVGIFSKFQNIMNYVSEEEIMAKNFKEAPELLETENSDNEKEYFLTFDSLRSNCRVTHQPDFGDVFIYYNSKKHIKESSLVKYLISFRSENHFHEECCEMIFKRLADILNTDDKLFVCALYTRRGGIDICPVRRSKSLEFSEADYLTDITKFARFGVKQ
ncbi:NADPH-dependent 7-cyano-7-deazaguanine reductase QueF [bacterium]|nr:NADPH-dependent 7-cyano-7-deazaguanine reductase QueF [bacterium]